MAVVAEQCRGVELLRDGTRRELVGIKPVDISVNREGEEILGVTCEFLQREFCRRPREDFVNVPSNVDRDYFNFSKCIVLDPLPPLITENPQGEADISSEAVVAAETAVVPSYVETDGNVLGELVEHPQDHAMEDTGLSQVVDVEGVSSEESGDREGNEMIDGVLHLIEGVSLNPFANVVDLEDLDEERFDEIEAAYQDDENIDAFEPFRIAIEGIEGSLVLFAPFGVGDLNYERNADMPMGSVVYGGPEEYFPEGTVEYHLTDSALMMALRFRPETLEEYQRLEKYFIEVNCDGNVYNLTPLGDERFRYLQSEDDFPLDEDLEDAHPTPPEGGGMQYVVLPWDKEILSEVTAQLIRDPDYEEEIEESSEEALDFDEEPVTAEVVWGSAGERGELLEEFKALREENKEPRRPGKLARGCAVGCVTVGGVGVGVGTLALASGDWKYVGIPLVIWGASASVQQFFKWRKSSTNSSPRG